MVIAWSKFVGVAGLAVAALSAVALGGCAAVAVVAEGTTEKQEDEKARKEHFETAAQTYYEGGKYEAAAAQWKKVLAEEPDNQKAKWGLAKSLAKIGRPGELRAADQIFEQIVPLDWSHPTRGDIRFEVEKDWADVQLALADFYHDDIRVLEQQAQKPGADVALKRDQIAKQVERRNALLRKAMPLYEHVLAMSHENPYALSGLAKANLLAGDDQRGIDYARRYIDLSTSSQRGWEAKLKDYEKETQGQVTTEQREFFREKIRTARQKELKMRLLVASVLMRNRRAHEAVQEYDAILKLDPAQPAAYVERAQAYAMTGDLTSATRDLEEYLKITDPVKQREARVNAAELLDQYRKAMYAPVEKGSGAGTPSGFSGPRPTAPTR